MRLYHYRDSAATNLAQSKYGTHIYIRNNHVCTDSEFLTDSSKTTILISSLSKERRELQSVLWLFYALWFTSFIEVSLQNMYLFVPDMLAHIKLSPILKLACTKRNNRRYPKLFCSFVQCYSANRLNLQPNAYCIVMEFSYRSPRRLLIT